MKLKGKKLAYWLKVTSRARDWYYNYRFPEEGAEVHFLSRLWGQPSLTFKGHEYHAPFECNETFEDIDDEDLKVMLYHCAICDGIGPPQIHRGYQQTPPATDFQAVFVEKGILKGIICHGMWLVSPHQL